MAIQNNGDLIRRVRQDIQNGGLLTGYQERYLKEPSFERIIRTLRTGEMQKNFVQHFETIKGEGYTYTTSHNTPSPPHLCVKLQNNQQQKTAPHLPLQCNVSYNSTPAPLTILTITPIAPIPQHVNTRKFKISFAAEYNILYP